MRQNSLFRIVVKFNNQSNRCERLRMVMMMARVNIDGSGDDAKDWVASLLQRQWPQIWQLMAAARTTKTRSAIDGCGEDNKDKD